MMGYLKEIFQQQGKQNVEKQKLTINLFGKLKRQNGYLKSNLIKTERQKWNLFMIRTMLVSWIHYLNDVSELIEILFFLKRI